MITTTPSWYVEEIRDCILRDKEGKLCNVQGIELILG